MDCKIMSETKSDLHHCYLGVIFPDFARPINSAGFNGTKKMAQGSGTKDRLLELPTYSYTRFSPRENLYWMKLPKSPEGFAVVPISATGELPPELWVSNQTFEHKLEAMNKGEN